MKQFAVRTAIAMLCVCSVAAAARADATAGVQSKIDGALKRAKSFVVTTQFPAQAYASTLVFVAPDRSRLAVAIYANTTDVIVIGRTSYSSKNGAPFEKAAIPPDPNAVTAPLGSVKVAALHSDVTIEGVAYGAFDTTLPLGTPVTVTCAYDKKSYRLARCVNDDVTRTYAGYDDPQNVVDPPKDFVEIPKDGKQ
ncbi:MAG: hypothetical protein ABSB70_16760 [Candidatus Velthaea sp.]|jgi:hypothetical protein